MADWLLEVLLSCWLQASGTYESTHTQHMSVSDNICMVSFYLVDPGAPPVDCFIQLIDWMSAQLIDWLID